MQVSHQLDVYNPPPLQDGLTRFGEEIDAPAFEPNPVAAATLKEKLLATDDTHKTTTQPNAEANKEASKSMVARTKMAKVASSKAREAETGRGN